MVVAVVISCELSIAGCLDQIVSVSCFVKEMEGIEVHCTFFQANLCAKICAELAYEFYSDFYADHLDAVSYKTPQRLGVAGVKAEVRVLSLLFSILLLLGSQVYSIFFPQF